MADNTTHTKTLAEESRLLRELAAGSEQAFTSIYEHYHLRLYLHILPFADSDINAKEAVQEVLFKLWARRETLPGIISLDRYLHRAVKNQLLDILDKERNEQKYRSRVTVAAWQPPSIEDHFSFTEYQQVAIKAIGKLPPQQRKIFDLRHSGERTIGEIAAITGSTEEAVYKNLSRAVQFIKKYLQQHGDLFGALFVILSLQWK